MTKNWIGVVSRAHVMRGVEQGIAQFCHGKKSAANRLSKGDKLIYYSPKLEYPGNDKWQKFTAVGEISTSKVYQVDMGNGFMPWRRDVEYQTCTEVSIYDIIDLLEFTKVGNWGMKLRYGLFEISDHDYCTIKHYMCSKAEEAMYV